MGCSKRSSKREAYSNAILPQETRKTWNRQPNFTPKTTGKRTKNPKVRRNEIIQIWTEINEKEMKEQTRNTEVYVKEEEIGNLPEKNSE